MSLNSRIPITLIPWPEKVDIKGKLYRFYLPKSKSDFEIIQNYQINCVVSVLDNTFLIDKVSRSLTELNIVQKCLITPNYGVPDIKELNNVLQFVIECLKKGENILIHCGAGKGRTGLFMACLLCCVSNFTADESIAYLRKYFPAVETTRQFEFVNQWYLSKKGCK